MALKVQSILVLKGPLKFGQEVAFRNNMVAQLGAYWSGPPVPPSIPRKIISEHRTTGMF